MPRDAEAYDLWVAQGVSKDRIFEFGLKDNFWQMGDTGPCGPCSEIHYDMGPAASDQGHSDCAFGCDCGRYVEIWNLVFMQFDRDSSGKLNPLPKPSIDTGMGLERVTAVLQGVISNYDTDLFVPLIERAAELTKGTGHVGTGAPARPTEQGSAKTSGASLRRTAEGGRSHVAVVLPQTLAATNLRLRYASLLTTPGLQLFLFQMECCLRMKAGVMCCEKLFGAQSPMVDCVGQTKPFLYEMVFAVRDLMQDAYPELKEAARRVSKTVQVEEARFAHTLDIGLEKLEDLLAEGRLSGQDAFRLYDTFGMPLDFMQDAARDRGIEFDQSGFRPCYDRAARSGSRIVERRCQTNCEPGLSATSEVGV